MNNLDNRLTLLTIENGLLLPYLEEVEMFSERNAIPLPLPPPLILFEVFSSSPLCFFCTEPAVIYLLSLQCVVALQ